MAKQTEKLFDIDQFVKENRHLYGSESVSCKQNWGEKNRLEYAVVPEDLGREVRRIGKIMDSRDHMSDHIFITGLNKY